MTQGLTYANIELVENRNLQFKIATKTGVRIGYFVEVVLTYPGNIKQKTKNFSLFPESKKRMYHFPETIVEKRVEKQSKNSFVVGKKDAKGEYLTAKKEKSYPIDQFLGVYSFRIIGVTYVGKLLWYITILLWGKFPKSAFHGHFFTAFYPKKTQQMVLWRIRRYRELRQFFENEDMLCTIWSKKIYIFFQIFFKLFLSCHFVWIAKKIRVIYIFHAFKRFSCNRSFYWLFFIGSFILFVIRLLSSNISSLVSLTVFVIGSKTLFYHKRNSVYLIFLVHLFSYLLYDFLDSNIVSNFSFLVESYIFFMFLRKSCLEPAANRGPLLRYQKQL